MLCTSGRRLAARGNNRFAFGGNNAIIILGSVG
jgi:hypothetical protein